MLNVDSIIEQLEGFQKRKSMYVTPTSIETVRSFLIGVRVGCRAFGVELSNDRWFEAQIGRGWKRRAMGPVPQMKDQGMSDEAIIEELIEIEVAMWRLIGDAGKTPPG